MKNRLSRAASIIGHRAVTVREIAFRCKFRGDELHATEQRGVLGRSFRQRDQMLPRANQDVRRRLWLDVFKREYFIVGIDELRRNFFSADFAEQAIVHEGSSEY